MKRKTENTATVTVTINADEAIAAVREALVLIKRKPKPARRLIERFRELAGFTPNLYRIKCNSKTSRLVVLTMKPSGRLVGLLAALRKGATA